MDEIVKLINKLLDKRPMDEEEYLTYKSLLAYLQTQCVIANFVLKKQMREEGMVDEDFGGDPTTDS